MLDSADVMQLVMMHTLGLSALIETLSTAAKFIYLDTANRDRFKDRYVDTVACYIFIQGTGLDIMLSTYGLEYNAEAIRDGFNYYLKRKQASIN